MSALITYTHIPKRQADIEAMLAERGEVLVFAHDFKRYVGAQIGIHNPRGEKVGKVSHVRNIEHVYVATRDPEVIDRVRAAGGRTTEELKRRAPVTGSRGSPAARPRTAGSRPPG